MTHVERTPGVGELVKMNYLNYLSSDKRPGIGGCLRESTIYRNGI